MASFAGRATKTQDAGIIWFMEGKQEKNKQTIKMNSFVVWES